MTIELQQDGSLAFNPVTKTEKKMLAMLWKVIPEKQHYVSIQAFSDGEGFQIIVEWS